MTHWEKAGVIVGVLVIAVVVLSVVRPASRISFGVFFERQINGAKKKLGDGEDEPDDSDEH